jgi:coatomer protein complex subunit gamma
LTEEDTEYVIHAVKHIFPAHVIVQFNCTNTIKEQCLENVTVMMDLADAVRDDDASQQRAVDTAVC